MSSRTKHPDEKYQVAAISKGLAVLEALEGSNFEPVPVQRIIDRTGYSRNLVERILKTYRVRGYALQNNSGEWAIGPRFVRLAIAVARNKGV